MKKKGILLFLCILLLLSGCGNTHPASITCPDIPITVVCGAESYAAAELMLDDSFRAELEETLNVRISLTVLHYNEPFEEDIEISFTGGMITDNCLWMVPMSTGYKIEKIGRVSGMTEPQYGQLGSNVYSYVFSTAQPQLSTPVLLVNQDILAKAGISSAAYTPEGLRELLNVLRPYCEVPLTVYGMPTEKSFSVLLNLFNIAPTGGHEFYLEDGSIKFDKIGSQVQPYLSYAHSLYEEGLIPSDCIMLNAYAARNMFLSQQTAFAMFSNETMAESVLHRARSEGMQVSAVTIPAAPGKLENDVYNRPIGLISFSCPYTTELLAIYQALEDAIIARPGQDDSIQPISFFTCDDIPAYSDPLAALIPEIGTLYSVHLLDRSVIEPYYSQILIGALSPESLEDMCSEWLNPYVLQENISSELSGASLLQYMNGWYYRSQKDKLSAHP